MVNDTECSKPIDILRKHAVHLYLGGFDDVTNAKTSDFHVSLYHWDSHGNKILLTKSFLNCSHTLGRAVTTAKAEDGILWLEAKVVPKHAAKNTKAIQVANMTLPHYIDW